ncbi:cytochrome P450 6B7-like [Clytia hemisphaerica]|uniref:cytochrome P450 6B7-like n=1 Tax=Clytia hemisphaerica TaxID=252671 RepID=UPI0034D618DF
MWWQILLAAFIVAFTAFYFFVRHRMTFWQRRGIPVDPGTFPFGSQHVWDFFKQKIAFIQMTDHAYKNYPDAPVVGTYELFGRPSIVIRDLDIAKKVLVKDFDQFMERKPASSNAYNPHTKNNRYLPVMLTELRGQQWKSVRASLTPVFTSGKLKAMVPLIHKIADHCDIFLEKNVGKEIEAKELLRNYALDVIVSTGFGYESDSVNETNSIFKTNADLMVGKTMSIKIFLTFLMFLFFPSLLRKLDWPLLDKKGEGFFVAAVRKAIKERQESGERRNDFIDTCLDILQKENEEIKTNEKSEETKRQKDEIERIVIANSLIMLIAGVDTVSSTSSMMMYFLAKNQDCQEKLYQEIKESIESTCSDQFDYAAIMNMPYMEKFFQESLRMYPVTHLERGSVNDYKIPGTEMVIPKDIVVRFPVTGIVKDEKYFSNPNVFDPENFSAEKKADRHPFASGGFGHGPRNCIAQRFATMEVKIVVARMLSKYKVIPCSKTVDELIPDPKSRSQFPKGDVWFSVEKR